MVVRAIGTCVTIAQVIASPLIQKSPMAYEAFEEGEHDVSIGKDRRSSLRNKNTSFSSETSELVSNMINNNNNNKRRFYIAHQQQLPTSKWALVRDSCAY